MTGPTRLPSSWRWDGYADRSDRRLDRELRERLRREIDRIHDEAVSGDPDTEADDLLKEHRQWSEDADL